MVPTAPALDEPVRINLEKITRVLHDYGLILESDPRLPNIAGIVTNEKLKGSWWSHPKGNLIYRILNQIGQQQDVLLTKLVNGKTTFIYQRLWPEFLSLALSQASWQLDNLHNKAKRLYETVLERGALRTDEYSRETGLKIGDLGETARLLERRLLVYGQGFHSTAGSHAKRLESWSHWMKAIGYQPDRKELEGSILEFSKIADRLEQESGVRPRFPWDARKRPDS